MNITQIENNLKELLKCFNTETFIYDLLLAYGQPKSSIKRLQKGSLNLSKVEGEIVWKKKLFFKKSLTQDLHELIDTIKAEKATKHDPRFIIVTDFKTLLAIDTKTTDTLDIPIIEIDKHPDFFLPWAGMEKAQTQNENPADVKAAERMAKLYDEIKKDNPTITSIEVHNLNVFLSRLLFCFFAEDTGIFERGQFTNAISNYTQPDGSDLNDYFNKLFKVMNTEKSNRHNLSFYLDSFPYVNGGLFKNDTPVPLFTRKSRQAIIDSGELDWSEINPDIFGSMIQAVISPEHRGSLGMHYTSVPNIMKVIEPLFLNELYEEFEIAKGNSKKLGILRTRIQNIKIFDPACGSGNFLIIAYKELRRLEIKIFKELEELALSGIKLCNFYGIELDDFAHEIATLSLWLAEHQMNQEFFKEFGRTNPALPLKESGNIIHGNACRIDWEQVCPKNDGDEIYILGNPPYVGSRKQDDNQKADIDFVFKGFSKYKDLDYIACWFFKGANYINNFNAKLSFVSTNSICQGEQVSLLWPSIFAKEIEIFFAVQSFKWTNNAKYNAVVFVVIIGLSNKSDASKYLFINSLKHKVESINAYLISGHNRIVVYSKTIPLSNLPIMNFGNMPADGGKLLFSNDEKEQFVLKEPSSEKWFKKLVSAEEHLNGKDRWCLWLENITEKELTSMPNVSNVVNEVKKIRAKSSRPQLAKIPHLFAQITQPDNKNCIIVPRISSANRKYIPIDFLDGNYKVNDSLYTIVTDRLEVFAIITSFMHILWLKIVGGKMKTDYRYSKDGVYNNFPFPPISDTQKQELEKHVYNILAEREHYPEKTLAQLYDPDKMPEGLREAHRQNDLAVERCYRSKPFESDEERLEYLFKLYEQMISEEKIKNGELNFNSSITKKKRK